MDSNFVDGIFLRARELTGAEERAAFLSAACGGDAAMRARLEAMLADAGEADAFFEREPRGLSGKGFPGGDGGMTEDTMVITAGGEPEEPGGWIGPYKLMERIGEGGFGTVWAARQEKPIRRRVALKIIKPGMDTREVIARFGQERQALAMMDHPNIAKVLDAGATPSGRPYFVMELVRGTRITDYCDEARLPARERLELMAQVCQAVQHAHQKGIIHRDLKPSNILVTLHDGVPVPKVIDFGIAKATQSRLTEDTIYTQFAQMIGTPLYMSPEQAEMSGLDIDTRSDIYSLGVLLYELLTGRTPFDPEVLRKAGLEEVRRLIREQTPPKPSTALLTMAAETRTRVAERRGADPAKIAGRQRGDLDWIVMKAIEKDRTRRYETANGLAQDIRRHLAGEAVLAAAPSAAYRFGKFARRNKALLGGAALIAVILVAAAGISLWQAGVARAAAREAVAARRDADGKAAAERAAREESDATVRFLTHVFQSPNPERGGRTITVAETLDKAVKSLDAGFAAQPALKASLQLTLGETYSALGLPREAVPLLERALDYRRTAFGPEHPDTFKAMHTLAISLGMTGRHGEALKLEEELLALSRRVNGPEHPNTITTMGNLAFSFGRMGRREKALKLEEEVLALRLKINGREHSGTIIAMMNWAASLFKGGRREEALKLREEALALSRRVNGPEHPDTVSAMGNLAISFDAAGRPVEALTLLEQSLTLNRKVSGPEHPDTISAMKALADFYDNAGRNGEALRLLEQSLPLSRKVNGPEHPHTLGTIHNLALYYDKAGRREEALKMEEEELALSRKVKGPEHPDTLETMTHLALSMRDAGRREEALQLQEETLTLSRKVNGPEHPETLGAMTNLALSLNEAGRLDEAIALQEQSLAAKRRVLPPDHSYFGVAVRNMANLYRKAGRGGDEIRLQEEALAASRKVRGPEHPGTLEAMGGLASALFHEGRREEAIKIRGEMLAISAKISGPAHTDTLNAMQKLADYLMGAGHRKRALALLAETSPLLSSKDPFLVLKITALQVWFGDTAAYQATCRRLLADAEGTGDATTAELIAKACCLLPSSDPRLPAAALALARRAVELGKDPMYQFYYQMSQGMAEHRQGDYAAAAGTLKAAMESKDQEVRDLTRLYLAMNSLRRGDTAEARRLFSEAETGMTPPADEQRPLASGASNDQLILWITYREAKAMFAPPVRTAPGERGGNKRGRKPVRPAGRR